MNLGSTTVLIGAALALSARSLLTQRTQTGWNGGSPSVATADPSPVIPESPAAPSIDR